MTTFILTLNSDSNSKFYGKIDIDNIGIGGHSQGGSGTINAVTAQDNGNRYKVMYAASAPTLEKPYTVLFLYMAFHTLITYIFHMNLS